MDVIHETSRMYGNPSFLQNSIRLIDCFSGVFEMLNHLVAYHKVECVVLKWKLLHVYSRVLNFCKLSVLHIDQWIEISGATYAQNLPVHRLFETLGYPFVHEVSCEVHQTTPQLGASKRCQDLLYK